jgi:hypothetical protein
MTKRTKLKLEKYFRISVREIIIVGQLTVRTPTNNIISFRYDAEHELIKLFINNILQPTSWSVVEMEINPTNLWKAGAHYFILDNNKRHKYIYVSSTHIGTRDYFGAVNWLSRMSRKQRRIYKVARRHGLSRGSAREQAIMKRKRNAGFELA